MCDLFSQSVRWRVNKQEESLGSIVGVIFTLFVVTISAYYAVMRSNTLINHGDSSVQALSRKNYFTDHTRIVLETSDSNSYNFNLMFAIWDLAS
jgi:hypothetical protein